MCYEVTENCEEKNFAEEAKQLFDAIKITGEKFGLGMPISFLAGSVMEHIIIFAYSVMLSDCFD